jgi:hypothetical protein
MFRTNAVNFSAPYSGGLVFESRRTSILTETSLGFFFVDLSEAGIMGLS